MEAIRKKKRMNKEIKQKILNCAQTRQYKKNIHQTSVTSHSNQATYSRQKKKQSGLETSSD